MERSSLLGKQRVLVIGCGFLGGHIVRGLALRGISVTGLSRSFSPALADVEAPLALIHGDARDQRLLASALRGVDEVIYCVGGLQPAGAEARPEVDAARLLGPLRILLSLLADRPAPRLTFVSSGGAIYGDPSILPVPEDHPAAPLGAYGAVRQLAEQLIASAVRRDRLVARILRCGNVYGEYQPLARGQGAVGVFVDRVIRGEPIELFGDGDTVRDYLYVGDLVEVIGRLIIAGVDSVLLNVGSGVGTSVAELLELVERALDRGAIVVRGPARAFDVRRVVLDVTRLRSLLPGYEPFPLPLGVDRVAAQQTAFEADLVPSRVMAALDGERLIARA